MVNAMVISIYQKHKTQAEGYVSQIPLKCSEVLAGSVGTES